LGKIAEENFTWYQLWDKVVESDMAEAVMVYRSKIQAKTASIGILTKR
jgi:acetyl-CoA synthetase